MDFWSVYEAERQKQGYNSKRLYLTSRDRIHLSLSTVQSHGTTLEMNHSIEKKYSEAERYVLVNDMTHDLLVSVYDVNTTHSLLLRFSMPLGKKDVDKITSKIRSVRRPNLELRAIGLQDNDVELLNSLEFFHNEFKSNLMELDLFGNETRHLAFDTKLGMSFNLLLLNRIYRPGELVNSASIDEFNARKSQIKFV